VTDHVPFTAEGTRTEVETLGKGFFRVVATLGFMENPDVPKLLEEAKRSGLHVPLSDVTYFLGKETLLAQPGGKMGEWEEGFFAFLSRNSRPATIYFKLPPEQVIEIGTQIDL
jgi:KUP system potassium uptake protein